MHDKLAGWPAQLVAISFNQLARSVCQPSWSQGLTVTQNSSLSSLEVDVTVASTLFAYPQMYGAVVSYSRDKLEFLVLFPSS